MTKVLITGSYSFIGKNFKQFSKFREVEEVSLIETDVEDINFKGYDVVLHLAAIVHQSVKISESEYFRINRDLCLSVADRARKAGVSQFILMSTVKVYGRDQFSTKRYENSECLPEDAYGKSKLAAETELNKLGNSDFIVSIIRTPLVYGEGVKANMMSLIRLVDKIPVLPFADVRNKRSFTFAENLVGYIDRIIEKKLPGIFIAMDEKAISLTELVNLISVSLGKKVYLFKLPQIILKAFHYITPGFCERLFGSLEFDNSKTKTILDYRAPFSTEEGIRKTTNYYLNSAGH